MKHMRLFTKTFLYTMLLMSVIIFISHMLLYVLMPTVYVNNKQSSANELAVNVLNDTTNQTLDNALEIIKKYSQESDASITLQVQDNIYLYSKLTNTDIASNQSSTTSQLVTFIDQISPSASSNEEAISAIPSNSVNLSSEISLLPSSQAQGSNIVIEKDVIMADELHGQLTITMDLQPVSDASNVMFSILPYTIGIGILLSLCAAYFYAKAITKPIKSICTSTKQMESLKPDERCIVTTQDEIGELADDINHLYSTLQQTITSLEHEIEHVLQVEQMKVDFLRCASHELKTPLTSLSVMLENMMLDIGKYKDHKTYLQKCQKIVTDLSVMVKEILDASSLEAANAQTKEDIIVDDWLEEQLEPYEIIAKAKGIHLSLQLHATCIIHQNRTLLNNVISNVISNAVQYTAVGNTITIVLNKETLIIENECEPIASTHLPHITEAFYRPDFSHDKTTGGNGLGLYLVDQILSMLELTYSFEPYEHGMRFTLFF